MLPIGRPRWAKEGYSTRLWFLFFTIFIAGQVRGLVHDAWDVIGFYLKHSIAFDVIHKKFLRVLRCTYFGAGIQVFGKATFGYIVRYNGSLGIGIFGKRKGYIVAIRTKLCLTQHFFFQVNFFGAFGFFGFTVCA